jgi:integrase
MRKLIKRENGTGSVYKRSDLHNRPWCAVTPEKDNVPTQIIGHYATAQEAKDALEDYRRNPTTKLNITLKELYEEWKTIAYRNISKQTQDNYNACWQKLTTLYDNKFRELRTGQMQKVIDFYSSMSSSTLQKTKSLLMQLFDYASENDIVNKNYASFITLPKTIKIKKDCFTELELSKIEKAVVPYADVILMMCYTGFRVGEFLELTPFSYSRENNTLTGGKKTEAGKNRVVPIHPKIERILMGWLARGGQTIVCDENGKGMSANHFRLKCYYPALALIGVRKLTPHATRHTCLTRLAAAGARPEDIQAIAGHEDYGMTANTYIHQNVDTLRAAILKMT